MAFVTSEDLSIHHRLTFDPIRHDHNVYHIRQEHDSSVSKSILIVDFHNNDYKMDTAQKWWHITMLYHAYMTFTDSSSSLTNSWLQHQIGHSCVTFRISILTVTYDIRGYDYVSDIKCLQNQLKNIYGSKEKPNGTPYVSLPKLTFNNNCLR